MSKSLRAKPGTEHYHPCPNCDKPVKCWWKPHGVEVLGMGTCDSCLRKEYDEH